jgi:predicted MFS family arabinose efflux permease
VGPAATERDLRTIVAVQGFRAFAYGAAALILGSSLADAGRTPTQVAIVLAAILAGMAAAALVVGLIGDRVGRRRIYRVLLAMMAVAGAVFALTSNPWILAAAALTGTMSTDANESGPITSLEQAMIGEASAETRVHVFGRYNAVAYLTGALGALLAGAAIGGSGAVAADRAWLGVVPFAAVGALLLATRLGPGVEHGGTQPPRPLDRSRSAVFHLAGLFALDAFAGGFVVTTFVVFWFSRRFGVEPGTIGVVIFVAGLLQAASSIAAARLGARVGLLRTMVGTHLPSNLLLMAVAWMPSFAWATAVLLARFALSQMDVPTRQAYLAGLVDPDERTAAAAFTNTARYVARPFGPAVGAALAVTWGIGAPFVAAGALKACYDVLLWRAFRSRPLAGER